MKMNGCGKNGQLGRAITIVLAIAAPLGCCKYKGPSGVKFSPNGEVVAFLWHEGIGQAWVDGDVLTQDAYLVWGQPAKPDDLRSVLMASARGSNAIMRRCLWSFSPDSRRVAAIVSPWRQLLVVDLASGEHQLLTPKREPVTSFAWLGPEEICYAVQTTSDGGEHLQSFWRQRIDTMDRTLLVSQQEGEFRSESWSPTGLHVLFIDSELRPSLLNVASGTVRAIGAKDMALAEFTWHPDGSKAFCVLHKPGDLDDVRALIIDVGTVAVLDRSEHFRSAFPGMRLSLEPVWSADGKFVLGNHYKKGPVVICPEPWSVTWLGEAVEGKSWVFRLPIAGWLGLETDDTLYGTDLGGSDPIMLLERPDFWAFSPDGTLVAAVEQSKKFIIHNLGRWWLRKRARTDEVNGKREKVVYCSWSSRPRP